MKNLWNDKDAKKAKDSLDLLVYRSRLVGSEPKLCVWGGGNTSTKGVLKDHCGRKRRTIFIKGSGSDLKASTRGDYPPVDLDELGKLLTRQSMSDEEMVDYVSRCLLEPKAPRPSIEVLLHAFIDLSDIDHTHADAILSITNTRRGEAIAREIFGNELIWIPYVKPGFTLAKRMSEAYQKHPQAKGAILEKHGLITWGEDAKTSYSRTIEMVSRAERLIEQAERRNKIKPAHKTLSQKEREDWLQENLPVIRGAVSRFQKQVLLFDGSPGALAFVNARATDRLSQKGPATPDHMLRTKRVPLYVKVPGRGLKRFAASDLAKQIEGYAAAHERYFKRYKHSLPKGGYSKMLDPYPKVILVPGIGFLAAARDRKKAGIVSEIYRHSISVMQAAAAIDTYESLSERLAFEIEYWPLELYKLSLAPRDAEFTGHVGLVTGAARGIGRAISEKLGKLGAHVFLADLDERVVAEQAARINQELCKEAVFPLRMDVTDAESVRSGFKKIILAFGGIDFLVSNAGVAHVAAVEKLELKDWEKSFAVNATGHFLVSREAVRIMKRQKIGGAIVFIASKNVLAPGRDFGAYSAAKAAQTQLARVLAIENGEAGIRVNVVNPDGVFEGSGLWDRIRADRAKTYGIPAQELERYYHNRNLMKTAVFPEDVAESAAFLISQKSSKTTGCILTVDGGVKEAFPR